MIYLNRVRQKTKKTLLKSITRDQINHWTSDIVQ